MSDLLTHWAVYEDSRRLVQLDDQIIPLFKTLMESERDYARLGAITRGGNRWMPEILASARVRWQDEADPSKLGKKVAFCLGGLTHQACDNLMKSLMARLAPPEGKREISAYYDVHVFQQVYLNGEEEPFNQFLLQRNATSPGQALEGFAKSLFQRALLSSHTLKPDYADIDSWLDKLFDALQLLYIQIELYVNVFTNPDLAKIRQYEVQTTFYDINDPAIIAARTIQRGESVSDEQARAALSVEANRSSYGQALALSIEYLRRGSSYWQGETETLITPNMLEA